MKKKVSHPMHAATPIVLIFVGKRWDTLQESLKQCIKDFIWYVETNDRDRSVASLSPAEICEHVKGGTLSIAATQHVVCTEAVAGFTATAIIRNAQASTKNIFAVGVDLGEAERNSLAVEEEYTLINLFGPKAAESRTVFHEVVKEIFELPDLSKTIQHPDERPKRAQG